MCKYSYAASAAARKSFFFISLIVITIFFGNMAESQKLELGGTRIVCRDADFEATFPAGFFIPRRDVQRDKIISYITENERGTCIIAYNKINTVPLKERSVENILSNTLSNYLRRETKITSSRDVRVGLFKGKSVYFTEEHDSIKSFNRFDCYVIGNVVLQLAFMGKKEGEEYKDSINAFFNSLSLINRKHEKKQLQYISEEKEYSIYLPDGYESKSDSAAKKTESFSLFPATTLKGAVILSTKSYHDSLFKDDNPFKFLDQAMVGALNLQRIVPISAQFVYCDEHPGISFIGVTKESSKTRYIRYDYYLKEKKLFQIGYACEKYNELFYDEVLSYFRSFEIIK